MQYGRSRRDPSSSATPTPIPGDCRGAGFFCYGNIGSGGRTGWARLEPVRVAGEKKLDREAIPSTPPSPAPERGGAAAQGAGPQPGCPERTVL